MLSFLLDKSIEYLIYLSIVNLFNKMKIKYYKLTLAVMLIAFAVFGRILLIDMPNVETLTIAALLAGSLLGGMYTIIIPLSAVALSDMFIGNDPIMIFTWSAWAFVGLLGLLLRKSKKDYKYGFKITGLGIVASLIFFGWTNFGVWAMWNMYPHTWSGLIQCFVMALPFLKMSLIGNLIIVPSVSFTLVAVNKFIKARSENQVKQLVNIK